MVLNLAGCVIRRITKGLVSALHTGKRRISNNLSRQIYKPCSFCKAFLSQGLQPRHRSRRAGRPSANLNWDGQTGAFVTPFAYTASSPTVTHCRDSVVCLNIVPGLVACNCNFIPAWSTKTGKDDLELDLCVVRASRTVLREAGGEIPQPTHHLSPESLYQVCCPLGKAGVRSSRSSSPEMTSLCVRQLCRESRGPISVLAIPSRRLSEKLAFGQVAGRPGRCRTA